MKHTTTGPVDIYPVGVLACLLRVRRAIATRRPDLIRWALIDLRVTARTLAWRIRKGDWRAVKSAFNGYLAEPNPFPDHMSRCGSGWTKRRAMRSLRRHGYR
ncbi:hypothetical protein [Micromonospora sp. DT229]|uniref:hypothetical protein n=1 Tax=Micromonospora sp. DT229 TaxID=3393430 RepID=UPI003CF76122